MNFIKQFALTLLFVTLTEIDLFAQSPNVSVTVRALYGRVTTNPVDHEGGIDPRWKVYYNNILSFTLARDNVGPVTWYELNTVVIADRLIPLNGSFNLGIEGWEEDNACGGSMTYNECGFLGDDDDEHCGLSNTTIGNFGQMQPGPFSIQNPPSSNTIYVSCGIYELILLVTYAPSQPSAPITKVNGGMITGPICQSPAVMTLEVTTAMTTNIAELSYTWEYNIGSETYKNFIKNPEACPEFCEDIGPLEIRPPCCDEPPLILEDPPPLLWRSIPGATSASINGGRKTFDLASLPGVSTVTENTNIVFRATAWVGSLSSGAGPPGQVVFVVPAPPNATIESTTASCTSGNNTGTIRVANITAVTGTYRYLLKVGSVYDAGCDPAINGSCLQPEDLTGQASGATFDIVGVSPGVHTLFLMNNAGTQGFCPRRIGEITVPVVPPLRWNSISLSNVSCNGFNNGTVSLSTNDGQQDLVHYTLTNITTSQTLSDISTTQPASVTFTDLAPGHFRVSANDNCTSILINEFDLLQPTKISAVELGIVNATCNNPGNGMVRWQVRQSTGAFDLPTSQQIRFVLSREGLPFDAVETNSFIYAHENLPPGSYLLSASVPGGEACNGASHAFHIADPGPIGIAELTVGHPSCYGEVGSIHVRGSGRAAFRYSLTGLHGYSAINTEGDFTSLASGVYQLEILGPGKCNDVFTYPASIVIEEPSLLSVAIAKTDVTCYDRYDGTVTAFAKGGSPAFTYTWELQSGSGEWIPFSNTDQAITGLGPGSYRVLVRDDGQCQAISNPVIIDEPERLTIPAVTIRNIVCFGERGSLGPQAIGGVAPYQYLYSAIGDTYRSFSATDLLDASTYTVMVRDSHGCESVYEGDIEITTPPAPLQFTAQLSNFNGYNISCFGGMNGTVLINASGGNGSGYNGYRYRVSTQGEQTAPLFTSIRAGTYLFTVTDGRGCEVAAPVTITQAPEELSTKLISVHDVLCHGVPEGLLEVEGTGGVTPYEYQLETGLFAAINRFGSLHAGAYRITVKDVNGCMTSKSYTVSALHPKINIQTTVSDVACFGGANGSINASVTGGVPPFQYEWSSGATTASAVTHLAAGEYGLTVTDAEGCAETATVTIAQPQQPLSVMLETTPVCHDGRAGTITVNVTGGTAPYWYSSDGGDYQQSGQLMVDAGDHEILVRDKLNCSVITRTTVDARDGNPDANFLVATTPHAMDTLSIVDVSVPQPDSIHWSFDKAAIVVSKNQWAPQLRFLSPGNYGVTMTGYFQGCDYSEYKILAVGAYDPLAAKEKVVGYEPIREVVLSPNPTEGIFSMRVDLKRKYPLNVAVYNTMGMPVYSRYWPDAVSIAERVDLRAVPPGVYLVRVVTALDTQEARIVISR